jgi:Protein of unknown function (DUF2490)
VVVDVLDQRRLARDLPGRRADRDFSVVMQSGAVPVRHLRSGLARVMASKQARYAGPATLPTPARLRSTILCILAVYAGATVSSAQGTSSEVRPESDVYVQLQPMIRIQFQNSFSGNLTTGDWHADPTFFVETALNPVLRRRLRQQPDVYRDRYLTFRAGYRYRTDLASGGSAHENRAILEVISRYPLPGHLVISDRNRGEFRFVQDKPFSTRYRNRLRLEYDFEQGRFECTPYADFEIFYDTRFDQLTRRQYESGVQFPVGSQVVLEPYYLRQDNSHSIPQHVNAFGFKFNLYF